MKINETPHSDKGKPVRLAGGFGARGEQKDALTQLRRIALTSFLFEDNYYSKGGDIANHVEELCKHVDPQDLSNLAIEARERYFLRRMPLFLVLQMVRNYSGRVISDTLERVIQRPDEMTDFLALYWMKGRTPLDNQVRKGLAKAFVKFNAYQLAKYNQQNVVKLRDVLFLTHAKPKDTDQGMTWKKLVDGTLEPPDTWEVAISAAGKDTEKKNAEWTRLFVENKLPDMAFLMNLRNLDEAGVNRESIKSSILKRRFEKILPTQFLSAALENPRFEVEIVERMIEKAGQNKLDGHTCLVVDTSGSMSQPLSSKSKRDRLDSAIALAILIKSQCENATIYVTAGEQGRGHLTALVPGRSGIALKEAIYQTAQKCGGFGIWIKQCMTFIMNNEQTNFDRVIIITDEQDQDRLNTADNAPLIGKRNYIMNVAPERYGVVTGGKWTRISGFSQNVIPFIMEEEKQELFTNTQEQRTPINKWD